MYENIGGKIKGLATVVAVIEIIIAVIAGLIIIVEQEILLGLMVIFIVPIIAWVSSWLLYGFGELIEKVCLIEQHTGGHKKLLTNDSNSKSETEPKGPVIDEEYKNSITKMLNDLKKDE